MNDRSTIAAALVWAADQLRATSATPRLDAELLLAHSLGWPRARLLAEGRQPIDGDRLPHFDRLIERRMALEPVAYLIGHKQFFGLDFVVDRRVLVPRPETELLVELALQIARTKHMEPSTDQANQPGSRVLIADIGTGSGCIAVALAVYLPSAQICAVDISPDALALARLNAERHGVGTRIRLLQGDLLAPLEAPADMIVSNPPYTVLSAIDEGVRRHEPHCALDGGPDGLALYRRLLHAAPARLRPGGAVLLEIGATQAAAVARLAREAFPAAQIDVHSDLAGLDRVVAIS